jgi:YVTN family beta-propeller protein
MRSLIPIGVCTCVVLALATRSFAGPAATYNFAISEFVQSPTQPIIYGTVPSLNEVVVIDAGTLQVTNTVAIGSNPTGLTLSPDGATLYVANSGSNFIARLDTSSLTTLSPFTSPAANPKTLRFGNNNRLWVLGNGGIGQIDATTGASTGPGLAQKPGMYPLLISSGDIAISPDRNSLFYGNYGLSPSNAYKYDVSGTNPDETWVTSTGGNGRALTLSHNGNLFVYTSAGDSTIAINRASDNATLGSLNSGGGTGVAFTPDDYYFYNSIDFTHSIQRYDMTTFLKSGSDLHTADGPERLFVDNSTKYLFAGEGSRTEVFRVGPRFPTPPPVYGTGVDDNGNPLGDGSLGDPHYTLVSIPNASQTKTLRVRDSSGGWPIVTVGPWVGDSANSAWIGPNNSSSLDGSPGNYDYRTTLTAPAGATSVTLTGSWAADDTGVDIKLNGVSSGITNHNGFTTLTPFTLTGAVLPGQNLLDFIVNNGGTGVSVTGLRVEIDSVTFAPEPTSLLGLLASLALLRRRRRHAR